MRSITFEVVGTPHGQGSMTAFAVKTKTGKTIAQVKEDDPGLEHAAWRNAIADVARRERSRLTTPLAGPLRAQVVFRFEMPKSRPKPLRVAGIAWRTVAPDLDKLCRLLGDGLTAGRLIGDDALIVEWHARKIEVADSWIGASVILSELTPFAMASSLGAQRLPLDGVPA